MNEENKIEELNPLTTDEPTQINPVPTIDNIEAIDVNEPSAPIVDNTESIEIVEPKTEETTENKEQDIEAEVLDIDLNREKPTVVTEQVIDKVTEKKQESKSNLVLVIVILLIIALAVIFIPQLSTLFK